MQIAALFQELSNKEANTSRIKSKFKKKKQKISGMSMVDEREKTDAKTFSRTFCKIFWLIWFRFIILL